MLNNLTNEEKCQVLACAIDGATSSIRSSANKITNVGIELSKISPGLTLSSISNDQLLVDEKINQINDELKFIAELKITLKLVSMEYNKIKNK